MKMNGKNERKKNEKRGETNLTTPALATNTVVIVTSVMVVVLWGVDAPCASSACCSKRNTIKYREKLLPHTCGGSPNQRGGDRQVSCGSVALRLQDALSSWGGERASNCIAEQGKSHDFAQCRFYFCDFY
jgi:hypothetical protein